MRPSNRTKILDAAIRVVQDDGVGAVTFDSVAAEAGLTRGGIMYHFPSRDELLSALHQYQAASWEAAIIEQAGTSADDATPDERLRAYVRVCAQSATRAELQLALEATTTPEHMAPWEAVLERWTPLAEPDDDGALGPDDMLRLLGRLAADGLWVYEALSARPLPAALREELADRIARLATGVQDD